jgi:hypothetical protein
MMVSSTSKILLLWQMNGSVSNMMEYGRSTKPSHINN